MSNNELAQVARLLKLRMVHHALSHVEGLDSRSAVLLQRNGFLDEIRSNELENDYTTGVILDPQHPSRIATAPGPMIVYVSADDHTKQLAVPMRDSLYNHRLDVRKAALAHYEQLAETTHSPWISPIKIVINQQREGLGSTDPACWRTSAIALADAVDDDFLFNLAGVKQCISLHLDDKDYFSRIMRPSTACLSAIRMTIPKPSEQHSEIRQMITDMVTESTTLQDACGRYYECFGHLPLGTSTSLLSLVEEWLERNGETNQVWPELWKWGKSVSSPLAGYHISIVFANRPDLVPSNERKDLWAEFMKILRPARVSDMGNETGLLWYIRQELVRHYTHHIESLFPGMDGERISVSSWWMAEQVSLVFCESNDLARHALDSAVRPEVNRSSHIHLFAHPPIVPSALRYASLYLRSPWSLSLLCQMGPHLTELEPEILSRDDLEDFAELTVIHLLNGLPDRPVDSQAAAYGFEQGLVPSASIWKYLDDSSGSKELLRAVKPSDDDDFARFADSLSKMVSETKLSQVIIAQETLARSYTTHLVEMELWKWVSGSQWRHEVLHTVDLDVLGIMIDALFEIQVQYGGKWFTEFPHILAIACEDAAEDANRRNFLFGITILGSLNAYSVSAIERLLHGPKKYLFVEDVVHWRRQFVTIIQLSPPWVAARMRAILAALYVT